MNIFQFADIINKQLEIRRHPNQNSRWTCHFEYCETKRGGILCSEYGDGISPQGAITDYVNKIKGKCIVFNAMSTVNRQEFLVPDYICGENK